MVSLRTKTLGLIFLLLAGLTAFGFRFGDGVDTTAESSLSATVEEAARSREEEQRLARLGTLQEAVKKVPASDYMTNLRMYEELRTLDPNNERFQRKYAYYHERKEEALEMQWHPERFVTIVTLSWEKVFFGTILQVDLTIKNALRHAVKDIKIKCVHSGPSGSTTDSSEHVIHEIIGGGSARAFHDVNIGFMNAPATHTTCSVVGVTRAE